MEAYEEETVKVLNGKNIRGRPRYRNIKRRKANAESVNCASFVDNTTVQFLSTIHTHEDFMRKHSKDTVKWKGWRTMAPFCTTSLRDSRVAHCCFCVWWSLLSDSLTRARIDLPLILYCRYWNYSSPTRSWFCSVPFYQVPFQNKPYRFLLWPDLSLQEIPVVNRLYTLFLSFLLHVFASPWFLIA